MRMRVLVMRGWLLWMIRRKDIGGWVLHWEVLASKWALDTAIESMV